MIRSYFDIEVRLFIEPFCGTMKLSQAAFRFGEGSRLPAPVCRQVF
jgi:hypothetical protein